MKIEVALQQVLSERDRAYGKVHTDEGKFFACDLEGVAEVKARSDDLWDAMRDEADLPKRRAMAKKIAAAALQYMTDCC